MPLAAPRPRPCPLQDYFDGDSLYGLEKFWAFHHYTGFPKGSGLEMEPRVRWHGTAAHFGGALPLQANF